MSGQMWPLGSEVKRKELTGGVMLYDASRAGNAAPAWFDPAYWRERNEIEAALSAAKQEREGKTGGLSRALLGKYDRIRTRRTRALYPLRGESCGNCDTAIPMQRRNQMAVNGPIDVCEACGVLLYRAGTA